MSQLKYLCSPITVRGRTYPNRIVVAPMLMSVMIHKDGTFAPGEAERVAALADGGCGCVIIGETDIDHVWGDRWNLHSQDLNDPAWRMVSPSRADTSSPFRTIFTSLMSRYPLGSQSGDSGDSGESRPAAWRRECRSR